MKTADTPIPAFHRATIAVQLEASLAALLTAEGAALEATLRLTKVRRDLVWLEDHFLRQVPCPVTGKNADDRARELRGLTADTLADLYDAEDARLRAASALEGARATFAAAKYLARLLSSERE